MARIRSPTGLMVKWARDYAHCGRRFLAKRNWGWASRVCVGTAQALVLRSILAITWRWVLFTALAVMVGIRLGIGVVIVLFGNHGFTPMGGAVSLARSFRVVDPGQGILSLPLILPVVTGAVLGLTQLYLLRGRASAWLALLTMLG